MSEPFIVPCAQCDTLNRIPRVRIVDSPKCGVCGKPVFVDAPFELTYDSFTRQIKGDVPLLVDVWASWCGPCRQFAPIFAQAAHKLGTACRLAKLNSEAEQQLAGQLGIRSIPSLILFRNSKEIARQSGAMPLPQLLAWLAQNGVKAP